MTRTPQPTTLDEALGVISALERRQVELEGRQAELEEANARLRSLTEQLQHKLDALAKKMFGRKADQLDPRQLQLALDQLDQEAGAREPEPPEPDSGEQVVREHKRKKGGGRRKLPADLPRRIETVEPSADERLCGCGTEKTRIREEHSEKLDYVPARFEVVRTVRGVWACQRCHDGVTMAPLPPQAVEKSIAAEGLLAQVMTAKFADHQPLNRQVRIFARSGVDLPVSTLCGWVEAVATALQPVVDEVRRRLLLASYLQTDDTPITVIDDKGKSFKGRIWAYHAPLERLVVYEATPTHHGHWALDFLRDYRGYLQADAYSGYDALYRGHPIVEVGCWAHARRRFVDAVETSPEAARMVVLIGRLYAVEDDLRERPHEARRQGRQDLSRPILADIEKEHGRLSATALPKSPLGEALGYMHRQWKALQRFLEDGRLLPDNNNAERQLRTVALGRKNWMFAGSMAGAHRAAALYTLVQCCRLAGIDCWEYFRDVLIRIATLPQHRIGDLVPDHWAAERAQRPTAQSA